MMTNFKNFGLLFLSGLIAFFTSCDSPQNVPPVNNTLVKEVVVPDFNQDSAYAYVAAQCNFGPRVPNTKAHDLCATYFVQKLTDFGLQVQVQEFKSRAYNGLTLNGKNIIASLNPEKEQRILLCAHWDSRPYADHDPDPKNHYKPIDGANDGASGVGVLMEIARIIDKNQPNIGVDIVLFDLEDYGEHKSSNTNSQDSWGLGSQYWSAQPHKAGYQARFGILLDMVGAKNPTFTKEHFSMLYASGVVDKVWMSAAKLGYGQNFIDVRAGAVTDDHYYINKIIGIPTIDIIHYVQGSESGFYPHWHTMNDNISQIDPASLKIVGQTVLHVLFNEPVGN